MNIQLSLLVLYVGLGMMLSTSYILEPKIQAKYSKSVLVVTWIVMSIIWFPAMVWAAIYAAGKKESK